MNNTNVTIGEDYKYILWAIQTTQSILFYLYTIVFPIGIALNSFEIFIFQSIKQQKSTMGYFFTINSVLNIITISYLLVFIPPSTVGIYLHLASDLSCKFYFFFLRVLYQSSSWLNVLITADRLLFIFFSKRFKFQQNKFLLSLVIFIFLLVICCTNIPNFMLNLFVVKSIQANQTVTTIYCTAKSEILIIRDVFSILLRTIIPFILMLGMNLILIIKVNESKKKLKKQLNQELKFSFTVIFTTIIFLIVLIPNVVYIVLSNIFQYDTTIKQRQTYNAFLVLFETCSSLGFFLNLSFNIFVQLAFNRVFSKETYRLVFRFMKLFNSRLNSIKSNSTTVN